MSKIIIKLGNYYDLHPGYHGPLLGLPNRKLGFLATKPKIICYLLAASRRKFHPAEYPFYVEAHQYPADATLIQSTSFPVLNRVPWVVDMNDLCPVLFGSASLNQPLTRKVVRDYFQDPRYRKTILARLSLYSTPYCKGILFWSLNSIKIFISWFKYFDIYHTAEVRAFLSKIVLAYPSALPLVKKARHRRRPTIIFMARDRDYNFENKGGPIVLEVFKKLAARQKQMNLIYCGPLPNKYKKRYATLLKQIVYRQSVPHDQALQLLRQSDILLFPTQSEAFGMILLEAMAAGCVPVTYYGRDVEVTKEIITNNRTGVLIKKPDRVVPAGEAVKFLKVIDRLLADRKILFKIKQRALRETVAGKFSIPRRIIMLKRLFRSPDKGSAGSKVDLTSCKSYAFSAAHFIAQLLRYRDRHKLPNRIFY